MPSPAWLLRRNPTRTPKRRPRAAQHPASASRSGAARGDGFDDTPDHQGDDQASVTPRGSADPTQNMCVSGQLVLPARGHFSSPPWPLRLPTGGHRVYALRSSSAALASPRQDRRQVAEPAGCRWSAPAPGSRPPPLSASPAGVNHPLYMTTTVCGHTTVTRIDS